MSSAKIMKVEESLYLNLVQHNETGSCSGCAAFQRAFGWLAAAVVSSIILTINSSEMNKPHVASAEGTSLASPEMFYI